MHRKGRRNRPIPREAERYPPVNELRAPLLPGPSSHPIPGPGGALPVGYPPPVGGPPHLPSPSGNLPDFLSLGVGGDAGRYSQVGVQGAPHPALPSPSGSHPSFSGHGGNTERHPPLGEQGRAAQESFLPNHPSFRPEMELPRPGRDMCSLPPQQKKQRLSQAQVVQSINSKVEEIIEELSSKNKFLPSEVVRKITMDLISRARYQNNINLSLRDVKAFGDFSKLHGRIDELVKIYCIYTPVTSVHELGVAIAYSEKVSSYEELHLGPLIKHPRVRDYFKPPEDLECPPEITVHQLHGDLTKLVDKTKRGSKHTLEDYLEFVRRKHGLESVAHLCVRIQSFPLLIQVSA